MQTRRDFLKGMGVAAVSAGVLGASQVSIAGRRRRRPPNVVLVMTDDQGYYDLGCHGTDSIQTPNLDELHGQSVRLTNFHVDPTCSPTRSALMTGRYSTNTGVWHTIMGRSLLGKDETTVADVFKANGYRTSIFGKWHLGDNYPYRPEDRGFEEVLICGGGGVGQGPDYFGNDYFDDTYRHNGKWKPYKGYCTDVFFDGAMEFIEANKDRPFFCYIPTNAAHGPYNVAEKYSKPYVDKGVPQGQANFWGMITNIDENMGRLMAHLQKLSLDRNTILIFMTDNGTSAGPEGQMKGKKGSEYEGGHRVPFFVRWPQGRLGGGRDVDKLTAHIDVLPTLAELCGLKMDDSKIDGLSIVELLRGRQWAERTLFVHSQRIDHVEKWRKSSVMTEQYRLVNGKELYDIKADPKQAKDIASDQPEIVKKMADAYEQWWEDMSEQFDKYCHIAIGADEENPTRLMSHDWHGASVPWSQSQVRGGAKGNGFWAVEVAKDGDYEFELRRWPKEVDAPITAAIKNGKAISASKAKIKIGDVELTADIADGVHGVAFKTALKTGETRLQTWFIDDKDQSRGAYYVYVTRL